MSENPLQAPYIPANATPEMADEILANWKKSREAKADNEARWIARSLSNKLPCFHNETDTATPQLSKQIIEEKSIKRLMILRHNEVSDRESHLAWKANLSAHIWENRSLSWEGLNPAFLKSATYDDDPPITHPRAQAYIEKVLREQYTEKVAAVDRAISSLTERIQLFDNRITELETHQQAHAKDVPPLLERRAKLIAKAQSIDKKIKSAKPEDADRIADLAFELETLRMEGNEIDAKLHDYQPDVSPQAYMPIGSELPLGAQVRLRKLRSGEVRQKRRLFK